MPRVSAEEKEQSHKRIVKSAASLMREKGIENTSVGDVMNEAGLTHGGFYRHFASKAELAVAALEYAVTEAIWVLETAEGPKEQATVLADYVDRYLSEEHVQKLRVGCPLAALATETNRQDPIVREKAEASIERVVKAIARAKSISSGEEEDLQQARVTFALLLGTITLARLSKKDGNKNPFLQATKSELSL